MKILQKNNVIYLGRYGFFGVLHNFFTKLSKRKSDYVYIIGPSIADKEIQYLKTFVDKADFFVTGENLKPKFELAHKQIGFWKDCDEKMFRFPNWMWHLDFDYQVDKDYNRFGCFLSEDQLLKSINKSYGEFESRFNKSVLITTHLRNPRKKFFNLTKNSIGCDGFGEIFQNFDKKIPKLNILEQYEFCLCPENALGDGYITEKIPEAFLAGCIPITWCRNRDLEIDFNSDAVINLHNLTDRQIINTLIELQKDIKLQNEMRNKPLLKYSVKEKYNVGKFILGEQ